VRLPQHSLAVQEAGTKRLYQWLSRRASSFRSDTTASTTNRTVRTEVTVERQGMTLLVGGAAADFDNCPLCGQKLAPVQAEQARLRLQQGSITPQTGPADRSRP
jgi:hypothetical protein